MSARRKKSGHTKEKRKVTYFIFPLISLVIAFFCIKYIITWFGENGKNKEVMDAIVDEIVEVNEDTGETAIDFAKLKEKNPETVGWLKVNNTNVDYPIVQAKDNDYYISHNFNRNSNIAGWVFVDYRMKLDGTDNNVVIYGHNMKDGSMFGSLKKVITKEWYNNEDNLTITYKTESEEKHYKVFSVYEIPVESYYTNTRFSNTEEHQKFLDTLKSRSKKDFGVNLTTSDKILTLSTCASNDKNRIVLHAVLAD